MSTMLSAYTVRIRSAVAAVSRPNRSSGIAKAIACVLAFGALLCAAQPAAAQFTQQGQKLVGTGAVNTPYAAEQGYSVALSADGTTTIVGGPTDNSLTGAAWVFSQSGGVWTQQGSKQVGTGYSGTPEQGYSVALSGDGNTAIVGGPANNSDIGATWVFTLGGSVGQCRLSAPAIPEPPSKATRSRCPPTATPPSWAGLATTRTPERHGCSPAAAASGPSKDRSLSARALPEIAVYQGLSVALSADGNTAIVGGPDDNSDAGAAWVFTRSGGVWTQQGSKLVGTGAVGSRRHQGWSVALSADGNTAIVGGFADNSGIGAAWVFTRSGGTWTQQGSKLVGIGAAGAPEQGYSVALSADGNTAIVGGPVDNSDAGAAWVFTRSGGAWTQQGSKLVGNGAVGTAGQGYSVALSADGNTAIVGGPVDNSHTGAAWVFVSPSHIAGLLTATPTSGQAPLAVTFRASDLALPMTYTVNFGDGTIGPLTQGSCFGSESGFRCSGSASHSYGTAGSYTAALLNASGLTLSTVTISANGNVAMPLVGFPATPPLASPPVTISTPTPERHSLDQ